MINPQTMTATEFERLSLAAAADICRKGYSVPQACEVVRLTIVDRDRLADWYTTWLGGYGDDAPRYPEGVE